MIRPLVIFSSVSTLTALVLRLDPNKTEFDPLAAYYENLLPVGAINALASRENTKSPVDPLDGRQHVFVVGPESSGTRLLTRIIGRDLGLSITGHQFSATDHDSTAVHISIPWGGTCDANQDPPDMASRAINYGHAGQITPALSPGRWNLHVDRLIDAYDAHGMNIHVVLMVRDPQVSLTSKMNADHCSNRDAAIAEQRHAYDLIMQVEHDPHVSVVCYEALVQNSASVLEALRSDLGVTHTKLSEAIYDGNAKYSIPKPYQCDDMIDAYNRLCPDTALECVKASPK